ncbi:Crp/Fnr family transcriptional regulator [Herbidospora sp. RD11066]
MRERGWPSGTFLGCLEFRDRQRLLGLGSHHTFAKGHPLIRQGAPSNVVYLLLDGLATVSAHTENGTSTMVAVRASGDVLGEMGVMSGDTRFASVFVTRRSLISTIHGEKFKHFLQESPAAAMALNRVLGERLRQANRRRLDFGGYTAEIRVARALLELGMCHGRADGARIVIDLPLTQTDLGALVGASEVTAQRAIKELRTLKLIAYEGRRIVIIDRNRMIDFADVGGTKP